MSPATGPQPSPRMGYVWHLRLRMAERGMFQTSELVPMLAERGVRLSREQVYRLVTAPPQRLSLDTLAALCDILTCTPNDLIEITPRSRAPRPPTDQPRRLETPAVRRATLRRPEGL